MRLTALLSMLLLVLGAAGGYAQVSTRAVLETQAYPSVGLPLFPANGISFIGAAYTIESQRLPVYLIESEQNELPGVWNPFSCSAIDVSILAGASRPVYRVVLDDQWTALVQGGSGELAWCDFLSEFRRQFLFFSEALGDDPFPPLPAVLDF